MNTTTLSERYANIFSEVISMEQGIIVFLNGTSSSGKTSISTQLINQDKQKFYHLSVDEFIKGIFEFLDAKYPDINPSTKEDEQKAFQILLDPIISMFYSSIKAFSAIGMNVVVDTVLDNEYWFNACLDLFKGHSILYVGVQCSLQELQRREQLRGDRHIGLAQSQYNKVHSYGEYDIELNTEEMRPDECANKIIEFIQSKNEFAAFKELTKRTSSIS
ncbi:chloramphenicol phosphotransferase CPT family protein [Cohnella yongneupensis]|uniref:Chloramphenicol phosphotransferase CPT family protein n=1 Tax=Cohnella yongneupensis TaxID=425006 RepID=A0ABW0QU91_9BACL